MYLKKIFEDLLDFIFPHLCVVCENKLSENEQHICLDCLLVLPKTNNWDEPDNKIEQFFAGRFYFQRIASFAHFIKRGSMQQIIHELKYKNNPQIGQFMGCLCGDVLKESDFIQGIDCIVPVPLHPKRQKKRGYNQSHEIAKGISEKTNLPLNTTSLVRTVNNPSQTRNSRFDRWKNVENIFSVPQADAFKGMHVLLVDDVMTTGSTIESCAREILKSHRCRVSVFTLASVE